MITTRPFYYIQNLRRYLALIYVTQPYRGGFFDRDPLNPMLYPLFRSNEVWWCKALKIAWKESNRRKGLLGPYDKPSSLWGTYPNHLEAMHQSELPHQWQMHSAAIKLRDKAASWAKTRKALLCKPKPQEYLKVLQCTGTAVQHSTSLPLMITPHFQHLKQLLHVL